MTQREKLIDKIRKMKAVEEGERKLGNIAAAETFAAAINRMLLEHSLRESDLREEEIILLTANLPNYGIKFKKARIRWQEDLAGVVADAHLIRILVHPGTNIVTFVGGRSSAEVAEYAYGTLVPAAWKMMEEAYHEYGLKEKHIHGKWKAPAAGFRESWLTAFVARIRQRFEEEKRKVTTEHDAPTSTPGAALIRLNQQLAKVNAYMDEKFGGKKHQASNLKDSFNMNADGFRQGVEAANRVPLGRKGVKGETKEQEKLT